MDKINNSGKWIVAVIILVAVIVGVVIYVFHREGSGSSKASTAQSASTTTTSAESPTSSAETASSSGSTSGPGTTLPEKSVPTAYPAAPSIVINLLTPMANDQWVIGQQNTISWSAYPNITGQIDLLNASDKSVVGVITSETEPHQTSYSWDTRSYNLGRYGGLMKDVVPGSYLIEVTFDGNNLPTLIAGPVIITN
jgi:hypothetical protein